MAQRVSVIIFMLGLLFFLLGMGALFYDGGKHCDKDDKYIHRRYVSDVLIVSALGVMTIGAGFRFREDISKYSK